MKKIFNHLKLKCIALNMANMLALAMVICTVNSTCLWAHHQPKVPEDVLKFRKF